MIFKSLYNLFQITLPDNWEHNYEDNIYSFFCQNELDGVLQISAYYSEETPDFDSQHELSKEKPKYPSAEVINLSTLSAVHYALEDQHEKLIYYYWITGSAKTKVLCSLIVKSQQEPFKLDEAYQIAFGILNTLKINSSS